MSELTNYEPRGEIAATDPTGGRLVAWAQAASAAHSLATSLVRTSFVPKAFAGNPADATAAIILGDELGLSPLSALRSLYVIGGTPALYARTMTALVMSHGHEIWTVEETEQKVTVAGRRKGSDHQESVTWTIARAQKAGYTSNKKYQTDPIAMLYARAAGDVARRIAPDVLAGVPYSVEEIELSETPTTTVTRSTVKRTVSRAKPEPVEPPLDDEPVLDDQPVADEPESDLTDGTRKHMFALLNEAGIKDRDRQIAGISKIIGREIASRTELTEDDARAVILDLEARTS
jgi:hypothetical protein